MNSLQHQIMARMYFQCFLPLNFLVLLIFLHRLTGKMSEECSLHSGHTYRLRAAEADPQTAVEGNEYMKCVGQNNKQKD